MVEPEAVLYSSFVLTELKLNCMHFLKTDMTAKCKYPIIIFIANAVGVNLAKHTVIIIIIIVDM